MKKLLVMALVAAAVAGTVNAASFDWKFTAKAADEGKTVYLVLSDTVPSGTLNKDDLLSGTYGKIANPGGTEITKKSGKTPSYSATGSATDASITSSSAKYFYVVVDGDNYWMGGAGDAKNGVYEPPASGSGASAYTASAALTYTPFAVPEPTTVALLALGLAALGLKRKVA